MLTDGAGDSIIHDKLVTTIVLCSRQQSVVCCGHESQLASCNSLQWSHTSLVRVFGDPSLPLATRSGEALVLQSAIQQQWWFVANFFVHIRPHSRKSRKTCKRQRRKKKHLIFIMFRVPTYLHCKKQTNKKTQKKFIATAVRTSSGVGKFLSLQAPWLLIILRVSFQ